jgi:hypothetical protein
VLGDERRNAPAIENSYSGVLKFLAKKWPLFGLRVSARTLPSTNGIV